VPAPGFEEYRLPAPSKARPELPVTISVLPAKNVAARLSSAPRKMEASSKKAKETDFEAAATVGEVFIIEGIFDSEPTLAVVRYIRNHIFVKIDGFPNEAPGQISYWTATTHHGPKTHVAWNGLGTGL
jgi:hypothetical protein